MKLKSAGVTQSLPPERPSATHASYNAPYQNQAKLNNNTKIEDKPVKRKKLHEQHTEIVFPSVRQSKENENPNFPFTTHENRALKKKTQIHRNLRQIQYLSKLSKTPGLQNKKTRPDSASMALNTFPETREKNETQTKRSLQEEREEKAQKNRETKIVRDI